MKNVLKTIRREVFRTFLALKYSRVTIEYFELFMNSQLFFCSLDLHEDDALEVVMRQTDLNCCQRILAFYEAPFSKFVGNVVRSSCVPIN